MKKRTAKKTTKAVPKKVGGKGSRVKGDTFERLVVNTLCATGVYAERVPLSGAVKGGSFEGDVLVNLGQERWDKQKFECKIRAKAWKDLYDYLKGNFGLFIRRDREEPLVVLRLQDFAELHGAKW